MASKVLAMSRNKKSVEKQSKGGRRRMSPIARAVRSGMAAPLTLAAARRFVEDYFRGAGHDELDGTPADLAQSALGHFRWAGRRRPGRPLVRVFNPSLAADG